ncbi:mRNA splicing protein, partial [Coemansia thaxteri]
ADEVIQDINLSYDAKRDRWNGYDPAEHQKIMADWELIEEARRKRKASELDKSTAGSSSNAKNGAKADGIEAQFASSDEESDDDDRYIGQGADEEKLSAKSKSTVRNLRIREDTAKYLRNLDPDSAYYDPKTRSMRENPYAGKEAGQLAYAGDNFIRYSGEAIDVAKREVFAWEAGERGNDSAHFQANPTQTALMYSEFKQKKDSLADSRKQAILSKYGGEEHLQAPPRELLQQTEHYVEYSRTGKVVGGVEKAAAETKYKEGVYPLNHSSVYGSWWSDGKWGYKCCRQFPRNAYCTAEKPNN